MIAIPSPDVVINLFASLGQLLGLFSILVGSAAVSKRHRKEGRGASSRKLVWLTGCLAVASSVSLLLYYTHVQDARNVRLRANLIRSSTEAGQEVGDYSLHTLSSATRSTIPRGCPPTPFALPSPAARSCRST